MDEKMTKVAGQIPGVLHEASQHMRKIAEENVTLVEENDALRRELTNMKLARRMEQRGLEPALSFDEKVAKVAEMPGEKLASLEGAIEMAAGGFRLGTVQEQPQDGEKRAAKGELYHAQEGGDDLDGFVEAMSAYD